LEKFFASSLPALVTAVLEISPPRLAPTDLVRTEVRLKVFFFTFSLMEEGEDEGEKFIQSDASAAALKKILEGGKRGR
jgi:hypothetical protein